MPKTPQLTSKLSVAAVTQVYPRGITQLIFVSFGVRQKLIHQSQFEIFKKKILSYCS